MMVDGADARRARKLRAEQRLAAAAPAIDVQELSLDTEKEGPDARESRRARLEQRVAAERAKHEAEEAERLQRVAAAAEKKRAERVANGEVGPEAKRRKMAEKDVKKRAALDKAWDERAARWRKETEQEEASRVAAEEARRKMEAELAEAQIERRLAAEKQLEVEERRVKIWRQSGQSEATASQMRYLGSERTETVYSWGWSQLENGKYAYGFTRGGDQVNKTLMALGIEDIRQASTGALALQDQEAPLALEDAGSTPPRSPMPIVVTTAVTQIAGMPAEPIPAPKAAPVEMQLAEVLEQQTVCEDSVSPLSHGISVVKVQAPAQTGHTAGGGAASGCATGDSATGDDAAGDRVHETELGNGSSAPHSGASDRDEEEAQRGEQSGSEASVVDVPGVPSSDGGGHSARGARQLARCRRIAEVAAARRARMAKRRTRQGATGLGDVLGPGLTEELG